MYCPCSENVPVSLLDWSDTTRKKPVLRFGLYSGGLVRPWVTRGWPWSFRIAASGIRVTHEWHSFWVSSFAAVFFSKLLVDCVWKFHQSNGPNMQNYDLTWNGHNYDLTLLLHGSLLELKIFDWLLAFDYSVSRNTKNFETSYAVRSFKLNVRVFTQSNEQIAVTFGVIVIQFSTVLQLPEPLKLAIIILQDYGLWLGCDCTKLGCHYARRHR